MNCLGSARPPPSRRLLLTLAAAVGSLLTRCAPPRIPGTDLEDTRNTREILQVMERFRAALEARDAEGILSLVAPSFQDDGGTATPEDDLDYAGLKQRLPARLQKLQDVKVDVEVRKIDVDPLRASVIYYFTIRFRTPGPTGRLQTDSDLKRMTFVRRRNEWQIASGL